MSYHLMVNKLTLDHYLDNDKTIVNYALLKIHCGFAFIIQCPTTLWRFQIAHKRLKSQNYNDYKLINEC